MTTPGSRSVLLFIVMIAVMTIGPVGAGAGQTGMTASGFVSDVRPISDSGFVRKAEDNHMLEVALGEMAAQKATSDRVKQFGRTMAKDYLLVSNGLLAIAEKNALQVPTDMDRADHSTLQHLQGLKGGDFDRQ